MRSGRDLIAALPLFGPALLLLLGLVFLPALAVFVIALTDWQFGKNAFSFVGWANFRSVFADAGFRASLINTLVYALIVVPGAVVLGFAIALLIEADRSLRAFYRAVHFLPFMATLAATAVAWEALLHPTVGLIHQILAALGLPTANWLRDEKTALPVLALIGVWQNLGYAMVLFQAGLKAVPRELYDAADIDGADSWIDRLRIVTLPILGPVTLFVGIVIALRAFETFDTVQMLTRGGPGHASELLLFTFYRESFEYLHTGYGAATAVVFLGIVATIALIQMKLLDKKVHYK